MDIWSNKAIELGKLPLAQSKFLVVQASLDGHNSASFKVFRKSVGVLLTRKRNHGRAPFPFAQIQPETGQPSASSNLKYFQRENSLPFWRQEFHCPIESLVLESGPADVVEMLAWHHVHDSSNRSRSSSLQGFDLVQHVSFLGF